MSTSRYFVVFVVTAIIWAVLFNSFIGIAIVNGNSMNPTYQDGDILFFNRHGNIEKGKVAIIDSDALDEILVKRIIATEGDTVSISDGQLFVNDVKIAEEYVVSDSEIQLMETSVPPNCVYVLGDNRPFSTDSRAFGAIPIDSIIGIVPFSR